MKKLMIVGLALALFVPAFAAETTAADKQDKKAPVAAEQVKARKGEFKQARAEHQAKMKATKEKAEKLVAEYNKAKGKKKDAKKTEIEAFVKSIHEEQLNFKEEQLDKFAQRLEHMKKALSEEKAHNEQWVADKTEAFIANNGDLKVLFDKPEGPRPGDGKKGPKMGRAPKGHHPGRPGQGGEDRGQGPRPPLGEEGPEGEMPF